MEKIWDPSFLWENAPSTDTPLSAQNLNKLNKAMDIVDDRIVAIVNNDEEILRNAIKENQTNIQLNSNAIAEHTTALNDLQPKVVELGDTTVVLSSRIDKLEDQIGDGGVLLENQNRKALLAGFKYEKPNTSTTNINTYTQLLHVTDIHHDLVSLKSAIALANNITSIDGILLTGDFVEKSYNETEIQDCIDLLATSKKPYYPVIGNHDIKGTFNDQIFTKLINPGAIAGHYITDVTYYYVDLTSIRLIVLNEFELPHDTASPSNVWDRAMTSDQLNWFCTTLAETPANLGIVVAIHTPAQKGNMENLKDKKFSANDTTITSEYYWDTLMHPDDLLAQIVEAYITKKAKMSINVTYDTAATATDFTLKYDFSKSKGAPFMCFIGGHNHRDYVWKSTNHTNQYNIMPVCSSGELDQMQWADMSKDILGNNIAFTVETFDPTHKIINLVRLGTDRGITQWNSEFEIRDYESIKINE